MWCGHQPNFPSGCADCCHLDSGCGWCWRIYSLCWVWVGTFFLLRHNLQLPCHGRVCSQVAETEILKAGLNMALLLLSVFPSPTLRHLLQRRRVLKSVGFCAYRVHMCCLFSCLRLYSDMARVHLSSRLVIVPDLMQGCGMVWAGPEYLPSWEWGL